MFCSKCGAKNNDGAKFCKGCGNSLGGISPQQITEPVQADKSKLPFTLFVISIILSVFGSAVEETAPAFSELIFTVAGFGLVGSSAWYLISRKGNYGGVAWVMILFVAIAGIGILASIVLALMNS